jgi:hypothetical protein
MLPKTLFEEVMSFHMTSTTSTQPNKVILSPRLGKIDIDTNIFKPKDAVILANWIERKEANTKIPRGDKYNFNLIYRGSNDDGFNINIMREKRDVQWGYQKSPGHMRCRSFFYKLYQIFKLR